MGNCVPNEGVQAAKVGPSAVLAVLTLVSFFNYLDRMAVAVLIVAIKRDLALSDTQVGLITGLAFSLLYAVIGIPIARLADRGKKARILAVCIAIWSAMTMISGAATSFVTLFMARMAVGVGEAGCAPTSFAIIAARFRHEERPLAISIFQAGGLLGIAFGMFGAGLAGQVFGWRIALAMIGACGLPVAILVALVLRNGEGPASSAVARPMLTDLGILIRRPGFILLVLGLSFASFAIYGIIQWSASFFVRSHGMSLSEVGLFSGLTTGVGGILGTIAGGYAAGRLIHLHPNWDLWLPASVYAASMPLFLAAILSPGLPLALAFNFVATTVAASGGGVVLAAVQRFTEPERRSTANALMLMISAIIGVGLGPVVVGIISDRLGPALGTGSLRAALALVTLAFLLASASLILASKHSTRTLGRAPPQ